MTAHRNYIGGEWVAAANAAPDINPSDVSDVVGEYARASKADAETAVAAAKAAFPACARMTPQARADALKMIGDEIIARKDELGRLLAREEGKPLVDGVGEVVRAGQIFGFFAGEALRLVGEKVASTRPGVTVEITREPVGVVSLITPWNFPIAIPPGKLLRRSPMAIASYSSRPTSCPPARTRFRRSSLAPDFPRARSIWSWDAARRSATSCWGMTTLRRCRSQARPRPGARWLRPPSPRRK